MKNPLDPAATGPLAGSSADRLRRSADLLIAVPAAIVTAPLVLLFCVLIRLESRGSPIFTQERAGLGGQPFQIFKLRTMVTGAEHIGAGLAVLQGDSRITRMGDFLRRYSLDELRSLGRITLRARQADRSDAFSADIRRGIPRLDPAELPAEAR